MRLQAGCYLCQVGDPHKRHETAAEVYGLDTDRAAYRPEDADDWYLPNDPRALVCNDASPTLTGG